MTVTLDEILAALRDKRLPPAEARRMVRDLSAATAGRPVDVVAEEIRREAADPAPVGSPDEPIAIVGMACRFPGSANVEEFADLVFGGRSATTTLSVDEQVERGVAEHLTVALDKLTDAGAQVTVQDDGFRAVLRGENVRLAS